MLDLVENGRAESQLVALFDAQAGISEGEVEVLEGHETLIREIDHGAFGVDDIGYVRRHPARQAEIGTEEHQKDVDETDDGHEQCTDGGETDDEEEYCQNRGCDCSG